MARKARINELGAVKRGDRNWERGMPLSWFLDSALRHLFQYLEGMTNEDHLAQAGWNIDAAMHTEEMVVRNILPAELMDLPNYSSTEPANKDFVGIVSEALQSIPEAKVSKDQPPMPITEVLKDIAEEVIDVTSETKARLDLINKHREGRSWPKRFTVPKPLRFYVGGPYSHKDSWIRERNTREALAISTQIARRGHYVLSPHAATGYLDGIMPYDYFMDMDFTQIIAWANAYFHIADSPGANRERDLSHKKGNPIFTSIDQVPYVEPNKYAPLDEQSNDARSSFYQSPQEGGSDGHSPIREANQAGGRDQTLHGPDRPPTEASSGVAEESR